MISYDVFTRSRSFANVEVQNDKCFLGGLCYFKVLKRHNKDVVCILWEGSKRENLCVCLIIGLLNKTSNLTVKGIEQNMWMKLFGGSSKWRDESIYILFQAETRSLEKQVWFCGPNNWEWMTRLSSEYIPCVNLDVIDVTVAWCGLRW